MATPPIVKVMQMITRRNAVADKLLNGNLARTVAASNQPRLQLARPMVVVSRTGIASTFSGHVRGEWLVYDGTLASFCTDRGAHTIAVEGQVVTPVVPESGGSLTPVSLPLWKVSDVVAACASGATSAQLAAKIPGVMTCQGAVHSLAFEGSLQVSCAPEAAPSAALVLSKRRLLVADVTAIPDTANTWVQFVPPVR